MLKEKFISKYPHITISRADRFRNTCERIAAPYRKNSFTDADAQQEYLQKVWNPRIRNLPKGIFKRLQFVFQLLNVNMQ